MHKKRPRLIHGAPYTPNRWAELGFVAGGTGIAPLLQMIRTILSDPNDLTRDDFVVGLRDLRYCSEIEANSLFWLLNQKGGGGLVVEYLEEQERAAGHVDRPSELSGFEFSSPGFLDERSTPPPPPHPPGRIRGRKGFLAEPRVMDGIGPRKPKAEEKEGRETDPRQAAPLRCAWIESGVALELGPELAPLSTVELPAEYMRWVKPQVGDQPERRHRKKPEAQARAVTTWLERSVLEATVASSDQVTQQSSTDRALRWYRLGFLLRRQLAAFGLDTKLAVSARVLAGRGLSAREIAELLGLESAAVEEALFPGSTQDKDDGALQAGA